MGLTGAFPAVTPAPPAPHDRAPLEQGLSALAAHPSHWGALKTPPAGPPCRSLPSGLLGGLGTRGVSESPPPGRFQQALKAKEPRGTGEGNSGRFLNSAPHSADLVPVPCTSGLSPGPGPCALASSSRGSVLPDRRSLPGVPHSLPASCTICEQRTPTLRAPDSHTTANWVPT